MLITETQDVPLDAMSAAQKLDVAVWLLVSERYERTLEELPRKIAAARALPDRKRVKELRRIKLSTWHGLSGRCLSDDPYRVDGSCGLDKDRKPIPTTMMAAAQSLRAAALELDIKSLVEGLEVE